MNATLIIGGPTVEETITDIYFKGNLTLMEEATKVVPLDARHEYANMSIRNALCRVFYTGRYSTGSDGIKRPLDMFGKIVVIPKQPNRYFFMGKLHTSPSVNSPVFKVRVNQATGQRASNSVIFVNNEDEILTINSIQVGSNSIEDRQIIEYMNRKAPQACA